MSQPKEGQGGYSFSSGKSISLCKREMADIVLSQERKRKKLLCTGRKAKKGTMNYSQLLCG